MLRREIKFAAKIISLEFLSRPIEVFAAREKGYIYDIRARKIQRSNKPLRIFRCDLAKVLRYYY